MTFDHECPGRKISKISKSLICHEFSKQNTEFERTKLILRIKKKKASQTKKTATFLHNNVDSHHKKKNFTDTAWRSTTSQRTVTACIERYFIRWSSLGFRRINSPATWMRWGRLRRTILGDTKTIILCICRRKVRWFFFPYKLGSFVRELLEGWINVVLAFCCFPCDSINLFFEFRFDYVGGKWLIIIPFVSEQLFCSVS